MELSYVLWYYLVSQMEVLSYQISPHSVNKKHKGYWVNKNKFIPDGRTIKMLPKLLPHL